MKCTNKTEGFTLLMWKLGTCNTKKDQKSRRYTLKLLAETFVQRRCETSFTKWCYTEKLLLFQHCDRCKPLQK